MDSDIPLQPTAEQSELLSDIWDKQAPDQGPVVDYSDPALPLPLPLTVTIYEVDPETIPANLRALWPWVEWVRLYAKPPQAVLAASRLAAATGRPKGGGLDGPGHRPGPVLARRGARGGGAALRLEPRSESAARRMAAEARKGACCLAVDESTTGLRLARGGASAAFGLEPDMVLWSPALPAGRTLGLLAGRGEAPPEPASAPAPEASGGGGPSVGPGPPTTTFPPT